MEQNFGNCRFVYNYFLSKNTELYRENKGFMNYNACSKELTILKKSLDFSWLNLGDSTALQNSLRDLQSGYDRFFDYCKKKKSGVKGLDRVGKPTLKKKSNDASYRSNNNSNSIKIIDNKYITIPKLGKVKCKFSKVVLGNILSVTISKNCSGKYFVSINCKDVPMKQFESTGSVIGIDIGLKDFIIDSNGNKIANPRFAKKLSTKHARLQRQLSRKSIGSENRNKARRKLAKLDEKIVNQRMDFSQKLSTKLIKENDVICLETLRVKNMMQNHKLAKAIQDASWSEFTRQLQYKADWYGKIVVKIDTFFPSSKLCNHCGYHFDDLTLDVREWDCPDCHSHLDRDVNAAQNILKEGLRILNS